MSKSQRSGGKRETEHRSEPADCSKKLRAHVTVEIPKNDQPNCNLEISTENISPEKTLVITKDGATIADRQLFLQVADEGTAGPTEITTDIKPDIADVEKSVNVADVVSNETVNATEERDFFRLKLGGQMITALCNQGSQISLINEKFAAKFSDRIKPHASLSVGPFGNKTEKVTGILPVCFEINGFSKILDLRVSKSLSYDAILGKDFLKVFDIDVRNGRGLWRSKEGKWCKFADNFDQPGTTIFGECASLAEISPEEWKTIDDLVTEELKKHEGKTLGKTDILKHRVTLLPGAVPVKHRRRRMSPAMKRVACEEVERMLAEDVIEPCEGAWSSAPVLVKKKNVKWRFCIDFRGVNWMLVRDAYQLPAIGETLDSLHQAKLYRVISPFAISRVFKSARRLTQLRGGMNAIKTRN